MSIPIYIPRIELITDITNVFLSDVASLSPINEGITKRAEIKRIPTALIEVTIVIAARMIKILSIKGVFLFLINAISLLNAE